MLQALIEGDLTPEAMAEFAQGRMRAKREQLVQALTGHLQAHHRFLLAEHLKHLSELQDAIARLSVQIAERLQPYEEHLKRLETIPGIKRRSSCDHPCSGWARYEPVSKSPNTWPRGLA
jgi:transposase